MDCVRRDAFPTNPFPPFFPFCRLGWKPRVPGKSYTTNSTPLTRFFIKSALLNSTYVDGLELALQPRLASNSRQPPASACRELRFQQCTPRLARISRECTSIQSTSATSIITAEVHFSSTGTLASRSVMKQVLCSPLRSKIHRGQALAVSCLLGGLFLKFMCWAPQ